jgi:phage terminase large subunit-like protein
MSAIDVHEFAKENKNAHIAIAGDSFAWVRDVMVEGPRGLLKTADPENPVTYQPSKRRIVWTETGTYATIFTYDSSYRLRGLNLDAIWY